MPKVSISDVPEQENIPIEEEVVDIVDDDAPIAIEDVDPDQEIWEGGPTAGQIIAWKNQHGDVYATSVTANFHVAWRTLTRLEFKQIVKRIEQVVANGMSQAEAEMLNEELICQVAILFPKFTDKDFAGSLAGLPSIVAQQVLAASGFNSIDIVQL